MTQFFSLFLIFACLVSSIWSIGFIQEAYPSKISVLNSGLPFLLTLNLKLETAIRSGNYFRLSLTNFTSSLQSGDCFFSKYPDFPSTKVECSSPNSKAEIFLKLPINILTTEIYTLVIEFLSNIEMNNIGPAFDASTVSSTDASNFLIYDYNPNFLIIPFTRKCDSLFSISLETNLSDALKIPDGKLNLAITVRINQDLPTNKPRIKILTRYPWVFSQGMSIETKNDPKYDSSSNLNTFKAPLISERIYDNPLQVTVVFNEQLTIGRSFLITINGLASPVIKSSVYLKMFTFAFNSDQVYEYSLSDIFLETNQNPLQVNAILANNIPIDANTPTSIYKGASQYLNIGFQSLKRIPANSFLTVSFGFTKNEAVSGTITTYGLSPYIANTLLSISYSGNKIIISNLAQIEANIYYNITVKVRFSQIEANFFVEVSSDLSNSATYPNFYGKTANMSFLSNADNLIANLIVSPSLSQIIFDITPSTGNTNTGSLLEIYVNNLISFNSLLSCSATNPAQSLICTLTKKENYGILKIASPTGINYFTAVTRTITIQGAIASKYSDSQTQIFEVFYSLLYDNSLTPSRLSLVKAGLILPSTRTTIISSHFSNDIHWTSGSEQLIFPSLINLVGAYSDFTYAIDSASEKRVITIYARYSFKNLIGTNAKTNNPFPCSSNIDVTCIFVEGDKASALTSSYFPDWDRVHIFLPYSITQNFHIIVPDIYTFVASQTYSYEICLGKYNFSSFIFTNLLMANTLSISTQTLDTALPSQETSLKIQTSGYAAAKIASFQVDIKTTVSHLGNTDLLFGAGVVIITNWELFKNGVSSVITVGSPLGTLKNSIVGLNYTDKLNVIHYLLFIPLINTADLNTLTSVFLGNVFNPFSLDLPDYAIYASGRVGALDSYHTLYNTNKNSFIKSAFSFLQFSCIDLAEAEMNTVCWLSFNATNRISGKGKIKISLTGASIHSDTCSLSYGISKIAIDSIACAIDLDFKGLVLSFNSVNPFPESTNYNLTFQGVDIDTLGTNGISVDAKILDESGNYIIENSIISVLVYGNQYRAIEFKKITAEYRNPGSITRANYTFTLPRPVYVNERLLVSFADEIYELNYLGYGLQILLLNEANQFYDITTRFGDNLITIIQSENKVLAAGTYTIIINGIRLPNELPKNTLNVYFSRLFDGKIVMQTKTNSAISFPSLIANSIPNAQVISSKYILEGMMGELVFQIKIQNSYFDSDTIMYAHFPKYLSPKLYDNYDNLYCGVNDLAVRCTSDYYFSYRLKIDQFPVYLPKGSVFTLTIYGFVYPKYLERVKDTYKYENILLAIDQYKNGSFSEIAQLNFPMIQQYPNPFYPLIIHNVFANNMKVKDFSTHVFELSVNTAIPNDAYILINFLSEYVSLENLKTIVCQISFYNSSINLITFQPKSCVVRKKLIKISLNNEIPSATKFNITLNDVPNPRSAITINLNKFIIKISYRNESTILSSSFYQTNQAQFLTFIDNNQDLLINEGREIVLSQGVYSEKFVIQPFEKDARFTNNLYLSSALPGFVMIPEENLIKIGDFSAEFSIGVDQDIINSVYSFNLIIQTLSLIGNYNNLNKIYVFVTNNKIRIDIPSEIVVPFGGCNLPYNLNFEKPPLERIDFSFFSADKIFGDLIKVDSEYSKMNYRIDKNNKIINFAFCRQYNSLSLSKFTVNVRFSGNNAESYYLSKDYFDVRFENLNDQMGTEPEIKLQSFQTTKTKAILTLARINVDVTCVWMLRIKGGNNNTNITYNYLISKLKANNFTEVKTLNEYSIVTEITNYFILDQNLKDLSISYLQPSTTYEFFAFGISKFKNITKNNVYTSFSTDELEDMTKILVVFNKTKLEDEMNGFLCFITRTLQTKSNLLLNSDGKSCAYSLQSNSFYFKYGGSTYSVSENITNIYIIPDYTIVADTTSAKLNYYFNNLIADAVSNSELIESAANFSVLGIENIIFKRKFNRDLLYNGMAPFELPSIKNITFSVSTTKYNVSISIANLELSNDGIVYFIMQKYMRTVAGDYEGEYVNQTLEVTIVVNGISFSRILTEQKPTASQIINCQNYYNKTADVCFRAVAINGSKFNFEVRDVEPFYVYRVYYVVANENPIKPTYNATVFETEILSYKLEGARLRVFLVISLILIVLII